MSYTAFLCLGLLMTGATLVRASEVTGTLSSEASTLTSTGTVSGTVNGTVEDDSSGSSGGGSRRSGGSGGSANAPSGSVLGAAAGSESTPGFPNAGTSFEDSSADQSLWVGMMNFLKNLFSF